MAFVPVKLEIDTDNMTKTVQPASNPMHLYYPPTGWVVMSWGYSFTHWSHGIWDFSTVSVSPSLFVAEVSYQGAQPADIQYNFMLLKVE